MMPFPLPLSSPFSTASEDEARALAEAPTSAVQLIGKPSTRRAERNVRGLLESGAQPGGWLARWPRRQLGSLMSRRSAVSELGDLGERIAPGDA